MSSFQPSNSDSGPNVDGAHELVTRLSAISKKDPRLIRSSTYDAPAAPGTTIRSWKMNEVKYYDIPSPFPTLARGLFTVWDGESGGEGSAGQGKYRIVARGYDKFFNIGEVPWTSWDALEAYTAPPYDLTLKSNGCIIFIAALSPTKLLVTSKHSLGPLERVEVSHAQKGEEWLEKHLASVGKTKEDLAKTLWDERWTAVAELCDDSFEEHVLSYSSSQTGLHLHGLNTSTPEFHTLPPSQVSSFASTWGFIPTKYHSLPTIAAVRAFTDSIAQSGEWNDEALEGFVVRCHIVQDKENVRVGEKLGRRAMPPYPSGSSFFFKVKFEEPYMMYRHWREITKSLLAVGVGQSLASARIPKSYLARKESKLYRTWVESEIKRDRAQFVGFTKGKGIIKTRERFLEWMAGQSEKEKDGMLQNSKQGERKEGGDAKEKKWGKTLVVPIAVPGCGKTAVAVALKHLFGFGHTQSDDISAKKPAPMFVKSAAKLLETHNVVIADRNNHLHKHRTELRAGVSSFDPPVRVVALQWPLPASSSSISTDGNTLPRSTIERICSSRIIARGSNHQTLVVPTPSDLSAEASERAHERVLRMFLEQAEELSEEEVDDVVEMKLGDEEGIEESVWRAVKGLKELGVITKKEADAVTEEKMKEALEVVKEYKVAKKEKGGKEKGREKNKDKKTPADKTKDKKPKTPRYYAILPEFNIHDIVSSALSQPASPAVDSLKAFYAELQSAKRTTTQPHVTLVHSRTIELDREKKVLWDACKRVSEKALSGGGGKDVLFVMRFSHLLGNGRVMALALSQEKDALAIKSSSEDDADGDAGTLMGIIQDDGLADSLHVTIGTGNDGIRPIEAGAMVGAWRRGQAEGSGIEVLELAGGGVEVQGCVRGLFA